MLELHSRDADAVEAVVKSLYGLEHPIPSERAFEDYHLSLYQAADYFQLPLLTHRVMSAILTLLSTNAPATIQLFFRTACLFYDNICESDRFRAWLLLETNRRLKTAFTDERAAYRALRNSPDFACDLLAARAKGIGTPSTIIDYRHELKVRCRRCAQVWIVVLGTANPNRPADGSELPSSERPAENFEQLRVGGVSCPKCAQQTLLRDITIGQ